MCQDMGPAISKTYEALTDVALVVSAIRELEARLPDPGAEAEDICIYKHTHIHTYTHTHIHTYTHTHIYRQTHTHIHTLCYITLYYIILYYIILCNIYIYIMCLCVCVCMYVCVRVCVLHIM
jgi:hypothetical protein